MKLLLVLLLFVIADCCIAQVHLSGISRDASNNEPLPYVNIGIRNKNIGTISGEHGEFALDISEQYLNDTITFSMVGYKELKYPVAAILNSSKIFALTPLPTRLKEVVIATKRLTEKKYGVKANPILHFVDASTNQSDIFEIAQVVKLGKNTSKITSLNLLVNAAGRDSGTFRINFYSYDGHRPAGRLIEKNIIQTHVIKPGWLRFDLSEHGIYLEGNVVVAIEFIPDSKRQEGVHYEIKPAGRARSFVRTSSLGTWHVPPHNYRMFITALNSGDVTPQGEETEKEIPPAFRLFSQTIRDSFSVFVKIPHNYKHTGNQQYKALYLLDANLYFNYVADSLEKIKDNNTVLVGIGYSNFIRMDSLRNRDYTYPVAPAEDSFYISGGGDKFYTFITKELMPDIERRYRIDKTNRSLAGHSLGGYFTLFALYKDLADHQSFFKNYTAASPSVEYHHNYLVQLFRETNVFADTANKSLHITWGSDETDGDEAEYLKVVTELINALPPTIKTTTHYFPHAGHMETAIPSFYNCLGR